MTAGVLAESGGGWSAALLDSSEINAKRSAQSAHGIYGNVVIGTHAPRWLHV